MNIADIKLAEKLFNQLKDLEKSLRDAKELQANAKGCLFCEHSDRSGEYVDYIYEDGNYDADIYGPVFAVLIASISAKIDVVKSRIEAL